MLFRSLAVGKVKERRVVCLMPKPDDKSRFRQAKRLIETPRDASTCTNVAEWAAWIVDEELRAQAAEKARLLYVALTRAEEALVVGLPVAEKEYLQSPLALGMLGAFPELDELGAGECEVSIEPDAGIECETREPDGTGGTRIVRHRMEVGTGLARVVELRRGASKDDPWQAVSAKTLAGFDGELPQATSLIPVLGTDAADFLSDGAGGGTATASAGSTFDLYDARRHEVAAYGWRERAGVYSYSSLRAEQIARERAEQGLAAEIPPEAQREAALARMREKAEETGLAERWAALKERTANAASTSPGLLSAPPSHTTSGTIVGVTLLVDFPMLDADGNETNTLAAAAHPNVTANDLDALINGGQRIFVCIHFAVLVEIYPPFMVD